MTDSFTGSCHCGKLSYTVSGPLPSEAMACNCSMCQRKGSLHHFTTPDTFTFHGSDDDIASYTFNKHAIEHQFCKACGCSPFAHGTGPDGKKMVEVNLRCVDGIDLSKLKINEIDGASL